MIDALARMVDEPAVTILGWSPSQEQTAVALALIAGATGAIVLMLLWRRARKAILLAATTIALLIAWIRIGR